MHWVSECRCAVLLHFKLHNISNIEYTQYTNTQMQVNRFHLDALITERQNCNNHNALPSTLLIDNEPDRAHFMLLNMLRSAMHLFTRFVIFAGNQETLDRYSEFALPDDLHTHCTEADLAKLQDEQTGDNTSDIVCVFHDCDLSNHNHVLVNFIVQSRHHRIASFSIAKRHDDCCPVLREKIDVVMHAPIRKTQSERISERWLGDCLSFLEFQVAQAKFKYTGHLTTVRNWKDGKRTVYWTASKNLYCFECLSPSVCVFPELFDAKTGDFKLGCETLVNVRLKCECDNVPLDSDQQRLCTLIKEQQHCKSSMLNLVLIQDLVNIVMMF